MSICTAFSSETCWAQATREFRDIHFQLDPTPVLMFILLFIMFRNVSRCGTALCAALRAT
jgi:hypothetical protein